MLPPAARLRRRSDFRTAMRRGRRAGSGTVVVHMFGSSGPASPRAGVVVSRAVGNAVIRNRVKRRLRALLAGRLAGLPLGASLVVRAQPSAATATSARLGADLDAALSRVSR